MALPKGWRQIEGREGFFYRVPERVRHLWDNKQTFKLGDTEAEAFKTWFERTGGSDELDKLTVATLLDSFIREHVAVYNAPGTYDSYKHLIKPLKRVFGDRHPGGILPRHMYRYMDARLQKGLSPGTVNRESSVMSSALNYAVRKGWIDHNPLKHAMQKVGAYKETPRDRVPSADELHAFTTSTYTSFHRPDLKDSKSEELPICPKWLRAYIALKMVTGLRKGQMLGINLTKHWDSKTETLTPPPSKGSKLTKYRGGALASIIRDILDGRLPVGPLFLNNRDTPVTVSGLNSAWRRAMHLYVEQGGEHFREHDIRKYTASEAATLEHAQKLLGHQSPKITAQVYRHTPEDVEVLK